MDHVDSQIFKRCVANDLHSRVWNIAVVDANSSSLQFDLLAIWRFNRCALKHLKCFLTMMDVTGE
jgi:hypothetical protein